MADGATDLALLLSGMRPELHPDRYDFDVRDSAPSNAFAVIREDEGLTVIAPGETGTWARISLSVHSSLSAVGLSAALARALADKDISCNIVAGYHHDHLFVPWPRRHDAMAALATLSETAA
ncbi:ACT domain-containing protein [Sphingomonas oryzagri]|uniref:ACT domain-containing protein n=1 Tax=Sphingomonas oryzagri TaxID=3042314 RepID=A0ABT6N0S6_9SPHN|nr:ACT domain-containing protein [Sphingomonas oryzagri]MDH7638870.1 ACT domain-containing protein [Sphingomonas oryzagri]